MSSIEGNNALDQSYNDATGSLTGGGKNDELDKEAFLKLLITQFQYQDPLNPMEDKEFIAQLAQFSALEQSMKTNQNMELLLNSQAQQTSISITNYIGKEVSARGFGVSKEGAKTSLIQYASNEELSSCSVNIMDSMGQIVRTVDLGPQAPGIHDFTWDGKKSDGSEAADGVYTIAFTGKNVKGEPAFVDTSVSGRVTGTSSYNGEYYLRLSDGRSVLLSNVREVVESNEVKVEPGKEIVGTDSDDYLEGEEKKADTISAGAGNDIILYDGYDKLVDGGEGFDFIIAKGDLSDNVKNVEAVLRGPDAESIKSMKDLEGMGISIKSGKLDMTVDSWKNNWDNATKNQWSYKGDKKVTIEILDTNSVSGLPADGGNTPKPDSSTSPDSVTKNSNPLVQEKTPTFSQALADGLKNSIPTTGQTLREKASSAINNYMKGLIPQN